MFEQLFWELGSVFSAVAWMSETLALRHTLFLNTERERPAAERRSGRWAAVTQIYSPAWSGAQYLSLLTKTEEPAPTTPNCSCFDSTESNI